MNILPTVDVCFKNLMGNPKVRKGFIAAILNIEPEEIGDTQVLPTLLPQEYADDKLGILDVRVIMKDDTQINMEMQVKYFEHWDERILFYLCKMFTSQIKKGETYDHLQKCIHVSILDFIRFPEDDECYRKLYFADEKGKRFTDKLELQFMELRKLPPEMENEESVKKWMRFFSGKSRKEFERMSKEDEYLDEAYNTLVHLSEDDKKRLEYEAREKAIRDYNSQMESAERRGEKRGRKCGEEIGQQRGEEIGEKRGRKYGEEIAEKRTKEVFQLYIQKKSPEQIAEIKGLELSRVKEILGIE